MTQANGRLSGILAGLLCLSVFVWSVVPSFSHAPTVFETLQDHMEIVESHGHSHGFAEDLLWAMHGHSHDAMDHDHSQAFLVPSLNVTPSSVISKPWLQMASFDGPSRHFPIDRPPRV